MNQKKHDRTNANSAIRRFASVMSKSVLNKSLIITDASCHVRLGTCSYAIMILSKDNCIVIRDSFDFFVNNNILELFAIYIGVEYATKNAKVSPKSLMVITDSSHCLHTLSTRQFSNKESYQLENYIREKLFNVIDNYGSQKIEFTHINGHQHQDHAAIFLHNLVDIWASVSNHEIENTRVPFVEKRRKILTDYYTEKRD